MTSTASPGSHKRVTSASPFHSATPPLSPKKAGPTPSSPSKPSFAGGLRPLQTQQASPQPARGLGAVALPPLYFPEAVDQVRRHLTARTMEFLLPFGETLPLLGLKTLLRDAFGLPACLAYPLAAKLAPGADAGVPVPVLQAWLASVDFMGRGPAQRAFDILRAPDRAAVLPSDFRPLMAGILGSHPGLAFLQDSPEFQDRYAETVVHRIFYSLNGSRSGRLSLRDIKRGDLLDALHEVEAEEDVNRCLRYFSYEHFYVIYCKFWDLDTDHDFLLSREDLLRYGNHSLTYRIADRLFEGAARPLSSGVPDRMGYEDFVWFLLSEEDKTTDAALDYWFRAVDLNGDELLTPDELVWFYEEQLGRMECLSQETVTFEDVLAQMQDMLNPEDPSYFSMRDLKKSRALAGTLFNVLFNLNKFVAFETRDPFTVRQEREEAASGVTEWERFARAEYLRLAVEEEGGGLGGDDDGSDGGGMWSALGDTL